jgi:uncharacterized protein YqgV (UPF0045/DUF77 family)
LHKGSLAIQVLPLNAGAKEDVYKAVDKAIAIISASGVKFEVGPFETTMEGDLELLWEIAYKAHRAVKDSGISSVITNIKLAESDVPSTIDEKVSKYRG